MSQNFFNSPIQFILRGSDAVIAGNAENENNPTERIHIPTHRDPNKLLRWYIATDIAGLITGFLCAWGVALAINYLLLGRDTLFMISQYGAARLIPFLLVAAGVLMWFGHHGHYRTRMPFWQECKQIISALGFAMLVDAFLLFAYKTDVSRLWLIGGWGLSAIAIMSLRCLLRYALRRWGNFEVPTLLIGGGETAREAMNALSSEPGLGYQVIAHIKDLSSSYLQAGCSWNALCAMHKADYVMIAMDGNEIAITEKILQQMLRERIAFSIVPPLKAMPVQGMATQYFFNHDIMLLTHTHGLENTLASMMKRSMDVAVSTMALILLSPLLLGITLIVKSDGGPAFFGHKRIGKSGKTFYCLKFRSMVPHADKVLQQYLHNNAEARKEWDETHKLKNDPRITRIGRFLRRSSLDELPQLINVLLGEMSLVGPRPIVHAEVEKYALDISHYYRVRPGITGLWQVSGRNNVSYPMRVQMDSWYVRNWTLWNDIAILFKTFPALLKRQGAC